MTTTVSMIENFVEEKSFLFEENNSTNKITENFLESKIEGDKVIIRTPVTHHNTYGVELILNNPNRKIASLFVMFVREHFPVGTFGTQLQGGHDDNDWKYMEFFFTSPNNIDEERSNEILDFAISFATYFNLTTEVN